MESELGCNPSLVKHIGMVCLTWYLLDPNYNSEDEEQNPGRRVDFDEVWLPSDINAVSTAHFLENTFKSLPAVRDSFKKLQNMLDAQDKMPDEVSEMKKQMN